MNPTLRILKPREVESVIAACCKVPIAGAAEMLQEQAVADYLRHALCSFGRQPTGEGAASLTPVHITRLLASVRKQLGFWLPPEPSSVWSHGEIERDDEDSDLPDIVLRTLRKLVFIKDCAHLDHGYYLPTPLRLVELPTGGSLVIGGVPTGLAEQCSTVRLHTAGLARAVAAASQKRAHNAPLPHQDFVEWLGIPDPDLGAWTTQYVQDGWQRLRVSASDLKSFTVYLPEKARRTYQYYRWLPARDWSGPIDRLYLCRSDNRPYRYWLGVLHSGPDGVAVEREAAVLPSHVRRLQYGLDLHAQAPVRAFFRCDGRQSVTVSLQSWLAWEELRLLYALGRETSLPGKWPLTVQFRPEYWPAIEVALRGLGIDVRQEPASTPARAGTRARGKI